MSRTSLASGRVRALLVALVVLLAAAAAWAVSEIERPPSARTEAPASDPSPSAHEMIVAGVAREREGGSIMLVLQEKGRGRFLVLTIGEAEALAIARQLEGIAPPRPLTHDLMLRTLGELGAQVVRVVVSDVREGTYYAQLVLRIDGREVEVDARPSDAVALALRAQAPIYAEAAVLERAAESLEQHF